MKSEIILKYEKFEPEGFKKHKLTRRDADGHVVFFTQSRNNLMSLIAVLGASSSASWPSLSRLFGNGGDHIQTRGWSLGDYASLPMTV